MRGRGASLAVAVGLDLALGEPATRVHPVAAAGWCLRRGHEPWRSAPPPVQRAAGAMATAATAAGAAGLGWVWERGAAALPTGWTRGLVAGVGVKPTFALRALLQEARTVGERLEAGDLPGARQRLGALVSRPTAELSPGLIASAVCESLAENLTDSVVGPWLAHGLLGLAGAAAYRVLNTADAMYGYRGALSNLGWGAAVSDDCANLLPARLSAFLLMAAAGIASGRTGMGNAFRGWRRDARLTDSPNAGQTMAAMAGALGRRLEKPGHYVLGAGLPEPDVADIHRAIRLTGTAAALALVAGVALRGGGG